MLSRATRLYALRETVEWLLVVLGLAVASRFIRIPLWAWIGIPAGKFLFSVAAYALLLRRSLERRHATGPSALVGEAGVVLKALRPTGQIKIRNEIWRARSHDESEIREGTTVCVVDIVGGTVIVNDDRHSKSQVPTA